MTGPAHTDLAEMSRQLTRLLDERSIQDTMNRYVQGIDYGYEDDFVDCFEPDGVLYMGLPATADPATAILRGGVLEDRSITWTGQAQLRAFIGAHTRAPDRHHKHFPGAPVITLNGDTATAKSYNVVLFKQEGAIALLAFGRYLDTFARCADGRWRIRHRQLQIEARNDALAQATLREANA